MSDLKPCPFCGDVLTMQARSVDPESAAVWRHHPSIKRSDCILADVSVWCDQFDNWNSRAPVRVSREEVKIQYHGAARLVYPMDCMLNFQDFLEALAALGMEVEDE